MKTRKENKFLYGYKLFVNYGHGYEYEIFEESWAEMKKRKREYLENCNYPIKISRGREENPRYKTEAKNEK